MNQLLLVKQLIMSKKTTYPRNKKKKGHSKQASYMQLLAQNKQLEQNILHNKEIIKTIKQSLSPQKSLMS